MPFGNESLKYPHIGLLSVAQAVADYTVFLNDLKDLIKAPNSKIIAFGGRYCTHSIKAFEHDCIYVLQIASCAKQNELKITNHTFTGHHIGSSCPLMYAGENCTGSELNLIKIVNVLKCFKILI